MKIQSISKLFSHKEINRILKDRSVLISDSKEFIFIHNYKVAGFSIRKVLEPYSNYQVNNFSYFKKINELLRSYLSLPTHTFPAHSKAGELRNKLPNKVFLTYFKFGFTRNPWDWQVSLYTYARQQKNHPQHHLINKMSFKQYIKWRIEEDLHLQREFFYDEHGNCLVDFIGKFETIDEDFKKVCGLLSIEAQLPHLNRSRENTWMDYYDEETIHLVNEFFKEDIRTFNYEKPTL